MKNTIFLTEKCGKNSVYFRTTITIMLLERNWYLLVMFIKKNKLELEIEKMNINCTATDKKCS